MKIDFVWNDFVTAQACKGLSWTIDQWGNRIDQTVTAGSCGTFHNPVDTNNRFTGAPYQYDAAGNIILRAPEDRISRRLKAKSEPQSEIPLPTLRE